MGPLISIIKVAVEQLGQTKGKTFVGASTTFGYQNNTLGRKSLQLLEILDDLIKINPAESNNLVAEAKFYHLVPVGDHLHRLFW